MAHSNASDEIQLYPDADHGIRDPRGNQIPYMTIPGGLLDWIESMIGARQF